jgi:hypothetical protein
MTLLKTFIRMAPEPGESGGDAPVDRGDNLESTILDDTVEADQEAVADEAAEELKTELDAEAEEKKSKKDSRIPLSRHKEILEKEREARADLERKLAQYQQGNQLANVNEEITKIENTVIAMEKQYAQLLTDGEIDKATAIMAQIRKAERDMNEAKSDMKIHAAEIRNTERARYNITLERVEAAFPTLNPDHEDFDEDAMSEVADLKSAYEMKGLTPTQALQKAVKMIVEPRTTKQEVATTSQPRVGEKDIAAERKAAAVKKTSEAVAKTPPNLAKVGMDSDKLGGGKIDARAVMNMSQKEFAKLNEETLAQLRGDML